jgi:tRNA A37 N6-isopentenylltransferase MiaA
LRSLAETVRIIQQQTWQFARRQRNWFERRLPAGILPVSASEAPSLTAQRILDGWNLARQDEPFCLLNAESSP